MNEVSWFRGGQVPPKTGVNTIHLTPENPNHTESEGCVCKPITTFDSELGDWICRHQRVAADRPYQPGMYPAPNDSWEQP